MSNCVRCNKVLSRHTKGDRCLKCYRNRNNASETDVIITDEFPKDDRENPFLNSSKDIRDTELIDNLKGQIDFLKDEIVNKNDIIDKLINTLIDTSENASIHNNALQANTRNTSSTNISADTNDSLSTISTDTDDSLSTISSVSLSDTIYSTKHIINKYDRQIANYRYNRYIDFNEKKTGCDTHQENDSLLMFKNDDTHIASWELYSKGFASKMLKQMGYSGKGLGKSGEGIIHPVTIEKKSKFNSTDNTNPENKDNVHVWPKGTTLIAGSSIISGIQENRLRNYKAKVRSFPGATISDMYHYLHPLLKKKPTNIILQIGSNDSPYKSYNEIANDMSALKTYITGILPETKVFLSCPVIRTDNRKANNTLRDLDVYLRNNISDVVINENIDVSCLGKRGLHLNPKGSGRLAMNYISLMKRL